MTIKVYTRTHCVQCIATYKALQNKGLEYEAINIDEDKQAFDTVTNLGYRQVPVVVVGDDHWSGFKPEKIAKIAS